MGWHAGKRCLHSSEGQQPYTEGSSQKAASCRGGHLANLRAWDAQGTTRRKRRWGCKGRMRAGMGLGWKASFLTAPGKTGPSGVLHGLPAMRLCQAGSLGEQARLLLSACIQEGTYFSPQTSHLPSKFF